MSGFPEGPRSGIREDLITMTVQEFGGDCGDLAGEVIKLRSQTVQFQLIEMKLRKKLADVQHDLDEAVGYRLATAEETSGDQDRDV